MDFYQAVPSGLKNYVKFQGRASRSEYWNFCLFMFLGGIITGVFNKIADSRIFSTIFSIATFFPGISIEIRRLHDINRTGWWILLPFTVIGIIPYLIFLIQRGTEGENRFGADPLA